MTGRPLFDPFAALAEAKAKRVPTEARKTFAELSQPLQGQESVNHQWVSENLATFAGFAGPSHAHADQSHGFDIRKKERFSLSFQGLTSEVTPLDGPCPAKANAGTDAAPAKAAILRTKSISPWNIDRTAELAAAKVSQASERDDDRSEAGRLIAAKVAGTDFEERAAFLEYECGLSREEAEAQAQTEFEQGDELPAVDLAPALAALPQNDGLALWRAGLGILSPHRAPCPGYRGGEWSRVYDRARVFLDTYGTQAEALGWTASRLFGVHPSAGIVRVDACGALVLPAGGEVRAITATEIRFGHLTHREKPGQPEGVPLWRIGQ